MQKNAKIIVDFIFFIIYILVMFNRCERTRKMKNFFAIVREKGGHYHFISSEYKSKKAFLDDLRANGYIVKGNKIYTESEYKDL